MSTKLVKYRDVNHITSSKPTTVVYGETRVAPSGKVYQSFREVYEGMQSLFNVGYKTRGIAKLSPEDTYDELTGIIVASKKAEKTGNKLIRKDINKFIKKLETLTADLKAEVASLEHREEVLSEDKH